MSDNIRRIRLKYAHVSIENGKAKLTGQTQNGARYEVVIVDFDTADAACAMRRMGEYVAEKIRHERSWHNTLREQAASAWRNINVQIEGEKKPS